MKVLMPLLLVLLSSGLACQAPAEAPAPRPNIVLIMADDMGYSDIGCFGSEISTPHLDRLAAGGLRMTHFYNAARCCPSRAALLTGLYPHQAGVGDMLQPDSLPGYGTHLSFQAVTLAEVLREAGYFTLISGKWHVGHEAPHWPMKRGFQRQYASSATTGHYFGVAEGRKFVVEDQEIEPPGEWIEAGQTRYKRLQNEDGSQWYATNAYTDRAIGYLQERQASDSLRDRPFFLYLPYTAPHWPLHALPEDIAKYRDRYLIGWDSLRQQRYERLLAEGIIDPAWSLSPRNEEVPAWDSLPDSTQRYYADLMAVYAAMVDNLDQNIGRLLDHLEASGELDHTLILFLSDNGACHEAPHRGKPGAAPGSPDSFDGYEYAWANASNTPFSWFKHWTHEGGSATPFIAWNPRWVTPGRTDHQVAHIIDLMPTLVELAATRYPETLGGRDILPVAGKSLLPIFRGEAREPHEALFWEHEGNRAVRQGDWKLVSRFDYQRRENLPWELYHLGEDRSETRNLAAAQPDRVAALAARFEAWAQQQGVRPYGEIMEARIARWGRPW